MGNKLWALALAAGAAYLFKTKKGNEMRKQIGDYAGKAVQGLRQKYNQTSGMTPQSIDARTA